MIKDRDASLYEGILNLINREAEDLQEILLEPLEKRGTSVEAFAKKIAEKGTVACHFENGELVAFLAGYTHDTPDGGAYITLGVTGKEYRKKNIHYNLANEFVTYSKNMGLKYVWVTTGPDNFAVKKAFKKLGFKFDEILTDEYTGSQEEKYVIYF